MIKKVLLTLSVVSIFILLWEGIVRFFNISEFLLPGSFKVIETYVSMTLSGRLFFHTWITTVEIIVGFIAGSLIGLTLGYSVSKSKIINNVLSPFIIAAQTTPKLALAPLFLIWFGFGIVSKILITALVVFFPIFVNTVVAVKYINPNLKELMDLVHANKWQRFIKLEVPSSLPMVFAGLKSGITLAVVGAVVGEFVGASAGLGYLIIFGTGQLNTEIVFTAIVQLVIIGIIFYEIVSVVGSLLMKWHHSEKEEALY